MLGMKYAIRILLVVGISFAGGVLPASRASGGSREKVFVPSSLDGVRQPCYLILPEGFDADGPPVPLLVSLHTWSGNVEQRDLEMEQQADRRGWIYLWPHFRGPNDTPDACGSPKAQQDILDAAGRSICGVPRERLG